MYSAQPEQHAVVRSRRCTWRWCCHSQPRKLFDECSSRVGRHHARGEEDVCQLQKLSPVLGSEHWRLQTRSMSRDSYCHNFSCGVLAETDVRQDCRTTLDKLQSAALSMLLWQLKTPLMTSCLSKPSPAQLRWSQWHATKEICMMI